MATGPVTVSIIIVTYNSAGSLPACLQSVAASASGTTIEIIIVDNHSNDDTIKIAKRECPSAQICENSSNAGFGRACNLGAVKSNGEFLMFVNPDAQLDRDCIAKLVAAGGLGDAIGLVVPRLRFPDGTFQPSCRHLPTISNLIFSRGSAVVRWLGGSRRKNPKYTLPDYSEPTAVPAVAGTVALIRRDLFARFNGFDPRFFMYMEDTDLSARLGQSGFVNLFVPLAGVTHDWGRGSSAGRITRLWHHHLSMWKYFLKHFPNGFSVVVLPLLLAANFLLSVTLGRREGKLSP